MHLLEKLTSARQKSARLLKDPATIGLWKTLVDKYADEAHFILELIQNADDANAQWCKFAIKADAVEFFHNGTEHFTITDPDKESEGKKGHLNALTSIAASDKQLGNKIGKFGIGFKSVFAYTDRPHIEDGEICIDIEDYIVPIASTEKICCGADTYFRLPLKNPSKTAEIIEKLRTLQTPLLYLNNINKIEWEAYTGESGTYTKRIDEEEFSFSDPTIKSIRTTLNDCTYISVFGKHTSLSIREGKSDYELGRSNVFCFFPTRHKEPMPYTIHAPFMLTDSRESIKEGEEWNKQMIAELAGLQRFAIERFGNKFISRLPFDYKNFFTNKAKINEPEKQHIKSPFHPLCSSARRLICSEEIYLCEDGVRRGLSDIRVITSQSAETLFRDKIKGHYAIIQERALLSFIKECKGEIITLADILASLTINDYSDKDEKWFTTLYSTLAKQKNTDAKNSLIIPTEGGLKKIFNDGIATVSLESVCEYLTCDKQIHDYLASILHIPQTENTETQISDILSFYENPSKENIKLYFSKLAQCYYDLGFDYEKKKRLADTLKNIAFIPTSGGTLSRPDECVIESDISKDFYEGVAIKMLEKKTIIECITPEHREALYSLLNSTGCSSDILIRKRIYSGRELAERVSDIETSARDKFEDVEITGFSEMTASPTIERSTSFCRMLAQRLETHSAYFFNQETEGTLKHYEYRTKNATIIKIKQTNAYSSIFHGKWLIKNNSAVSPSEISSSTELPTEYDELPLSVFLYLGIKRENRTTDILKILHEAGLTDKQLLEIAEEVRKGRKIRFE